ncbi:hypothetical protein OsI_09827 [Oryza sativa Indica Group]|uniref:Uncharacterized protein n=2 Tax=Oryza TaxID=4527 RepID=A0A0E0GG77_ORYNI|nr:hypothetical protein OsI_09827 [Oryza sativa Indica Group]
MAAIFPHLASTLPLLRAVRTPRRLPPAVSAVPPRAARVVLRGFRLPDPAARKFLCFEDSIGLQTEHQKPDSTSTGAKQNSSSDDNSSSTDGPPVLTILAGIIVFLLVLWVIGSLFTWISGLVFGAAKS